MSSLEFDHNANSYRIRFRYGGRAFKRSLHTASMKRAEASAARIEDTLMLLAAGRLEIPADADPVAFIVSDGKKCRPVEQPRLLAAVPAVSATDPFLFWLLPHAATNNKARPNEKSPMSL